MAADNKTGKARVGVVTECTCDLPKSYITKHNIGIVYFLIETDSGSFTDTDEITADNVIEYLNAGGDRSLSKPASAEFYKRTFEKMLEKYDEVIHIAISACTSLSLNNAQMAVRQMGKAGKRVHLLDSKHLSSGIGLLVMKAVEMAESGSGADEIITALEEYRERIVTSFITENADQLRRNNRVSEKVKRLVDIFNAHPVLIMRDGKITLKTILFGNYEKACIRYVDRILTDVETIDKKRVFITHVGCTLKKVEHIREVVTKKCRFGQVIAPKASATISSSCGPDTFGIMYVRTGGKTP